MSYVKNLLMRELAKKAVEAYEREDIVSELTECGCGNRTNRIGGACSLRCAHGN